MMRPRRRGKLAVSLASSALILASLLSTHAQGVQATAAARVMRGAGISIVRSSHASFVRRLAATARIPVTVALQPPHQTAEEQFVQSLQNRHSSNFHRYLSPEEWNKLFAPTSQTELQVVTWLRSQGLVVTHRYANRLIIDAAGPVSAVEQHSGSRSTITAHTSACPSLPTIDRQKSHRPSAPGTRTWSRRLCRAQLQLNDDQEPERLSQYPCADSPRWVTGTAVRLLECKPCAWQGGIRGRPSHVFTNGYYDPHNLYSSNEYSVGALYGLSHCCNPFHSPSTSSPAVTSIAIATACPFSGSDLDTFANQYRLA